MSETQIPGFQILERLGEGGMSTVWKARQISLDRVVAIKVLSSKMALDASDIKQFQFEAQAAARLKHPGIVQVYDASITDGLNYIVMEYVAGYTVGDWVRRKQRLSEADVLLVAECVADALRYAWEHAGIIHCDVKPDNVIVDSDGTVKVADLGLARTINAVGSEQVEEVMGTPNYISPEQSSGSQDLGCRSDIYSLGAMMYHLATGRLMFEGEEAGRIMDLQITETVPDCAELCPDLSPGLCWLIEMMLVKEADRRIASWDDVLKDVDRVKRGLLPSGAYPDADESTMCRSAERDAIRPSQSSKPKVQVNNSGGRARATRHRPVASKGPRLLVWSIVLVVVLFVYLLMQQIHKASERPLPPPNTSGGMPRVAVAPVETAEARAERRYNEALDWSREHPSSYDGAVWRFGVVRDQSTGTRFAALANTEIARVEARKADAVADILGNLDEESAALANARRTRDAVAIYTSYSGDLADQTSSARQARAQNLRQRVAAGEFGQGPTRNPGGRGEVRPPEPQADGFEAEMERVAKTLLGSDIGMAQRRLRAMREDPRLAGHAIEIGRAEQTLADFFEIDARIVDSFQRQVGQRVPLNLASGEEVMAIIKSVVAEERVVVRVPLGTDTGNATREMSFVVDELDVSERMKRMGRDEWPEVALAKGLLALDANATEYALKSFERLGGALGRALLSALGDTTPEVAPRAVEHSEAGVRALGLILHSLGLTLPEVYDVGTWRAAVNAHPFSAAERNLARELAGDFRATYGTTAFGRDCEPILQALED